MDFDYDVVIVGSGVAGALCASELSKNDRLKILILEAGENGLGANQRAEFVRNYRLATIKSVPSPYAAVESQFAPGSDGTGDPRIMNLYYEEAGKELFKSGFLRIVGGSTWGWRGNTP